MAYTLPSKGQRDWDDELNNSLEYLRGVAEAAKAAADNATSTANTARSRLDGMQGDTASKVVDALNNEQTVKDALSASYAQRWKANTAYTAGDTVIAPDGSLVKAKANFTSGTTYSAANWTSVAATAGTQAKADLDATIATATATRLGVDLQLPYYARPRTKSWDPRLSLYNGESPSLRKIREGIRKGLRGKASYRLAFVGDSKTFGSGITAGTHSGLDSFPAQFATLVGGSQGMIVANGSDLRWSAKTNFADPPANRSDMTAGTGGGSVTFTSLEPHTGFKLYGYLSPGGTVTVTVDGGTGQTWTIAAGSPWRTFTVTGLADATHTVKIDAPAGFALRGIEQTYSDTRLLVDNAGRQGSTSTLWKDTSSFITYGSSTFDGNSSPKPSGVVINLGTNTPTAETDFDDFVYHVWSSTGGNLNLPCLLVSPGGLGGTSAETTYDARRDRIYDVADNLDLAVLDMGAVIGNYAAANAAGLMGDTTHENVRGYALEAAAVARALVIGS